MNEKSRLIDLLKGHEVDRPPVILPGGLVNMCSFDVMALCAPHGHCGGSDTEVHQNPSLLTSLSRKIYEFCGVESLALPFTMTVESEAYGGEVEATVGTRGTGGYRYPLGKAGEYKSLGPLDPKADGRMPLVLEVIKRLADGEADTRPPVIGDLVSPIALATSLIDPRALMKSMVTEAGSAARLLNHLTNNSIVFGRALINSGADLIFITDPFSNYRNLGPEYTREFSVRYTNMLIEGLKGEGVPVILHLCDNIEGLTKMIPQLKADCYSVDSCLSIKELRSLLPGVRFMGNVSCGVLEGGTTDDVKRAAERAVEEGVDIAAPSCSLTGGVKAENLRAMTDTVKGV